MRRTWLTWTLAVLTLFGSPTGAHAIEPGKRFVSVAFHDVVDDPAGLDGDAVTTARLVAFFDYLRGAGWTAITLDDVDAARRGERALPDKAILLTFDDGFASLYTRVYPLLLAYGVPIVATLEVSWLEPSAGSQVPYGDGSVPREKFVSWEQVREMARSGLVEFASHSYDLHRAVPANPQGNVMPAAVNRLHVDGAYEGEAAYRARVLDDLQRSRDVLASVLGQPPRALAWPFGRYSAVTTEIAQSLGFRFALTLDPEPADAAVPMALARYLPTANPVLAEIDANLRFRPRLPSMQRMVCVDPATLWTGDAGTTDVRLGRLIERVRQLGSTAVVIDALARDARGRVDASWFPSGELPLRADLLSRLAWQLQSRAGVEVWLRLSPAEALAALGDAARVHRLFGELGIQVPASGLFVEGAPGLVGLRVEVDEEGAMPWQVRQLRAQSAGTALAPTDALVLQAYQEVSRWRSKFKLVLLASADAPYKPSAVADLTLFPATVESAPQVIERFVAQRPPGINAGRRIGLWFVDSEPPAAAALVGAARRFRSSGGNAFGWCPDDALADAPPAAQLAPDVSASSFPIKF